MKAAWFSVALLALLAPLALSETRTIPLEEARKLVQVALPTAARKLPGLTLVPDKCAQPPCRCRTFDILWSNPTGSPHYDFFTVDIRTGEVWISILCRRVSNRELRRMQREIRKRLSVTAEEYKQVLATPPCCSKP